MRAARPFTRRTAGYQAKEQAEYQAENTILWRKRPKKSDRPAPKFGA
jgi:hypothetical protein